MYVSPAATSLRVWKGRAVRDGYVADYAASLASVLVYFLGLWVIKSM